MSTFSFNNSVHSLPLAAAQIEALCDRHSSTPPCPVIIEAAGELAPGADLAAVPPVSAGGWPLWPEDQGPPPLGVREAAFRLDIAQQLKQAGNEAYKQVGWGLGLPDTLLQLIHLAPNRCYVNNQTSLVPAAAAAAAAPAAVRVMLAPRCPATSKQPASCPGPASSCVMRQGTWT
jgi:hypothetical protein